MRRVGIVATSRPDFGGTYQYTLSMIEALGETSAIRVVVYVPKGKIYFESLPVEVRRLPTVASAVGQFLLRWITGNTRERSCSGIDILIAPIYTTRLLLYGVPFIFTLHDMQERYFPEYFSVVQRLWRRWTNTLLARHSAAIICESAYVKADILKFLGVSSSKVHIIPAPPISRVAHGNVSASALIKTKATLALPEEYVFYPAQFFPHKNHERLVRAFAMLRDRFPKCCLVLTGARRYKYDRVRACAETLGISSRVVHLGYIDASDLAAVYLLARCVVVPTLFESISIPIYEAFSLGVPVCASRVVGIPDQVGSGALLFDPMSEADIAEKLSALLESDELRVKMAALGKERMSELCIGRYAQQLRHVLESTCEQLS